MTPSRKILVTGATGTQGGGVVRHCLAAQHQVTALVRDPNSPAAQALSEMGSQVAQGDFADPDSLNKAAVGMDAVFLNVHVTQPAHDEIDHAKNVIAAAKAAGVPMLVYSSVVMTGKHESFPNWGEQHPQYWYWKNKHAIEEMVRGAGFKYWIITRPAFFLQNFVQPKVSFMFPELPSEHVLKVAYKPETKLTLVDGGDVGRVAAAALSHPEDYAGRAIDLAVEEVTPPQLAERLTKAWGRTVQLQYISEEELEAFAGHPIIQAQLWNNEVGYKVDNIPDVVNEFHLTGVDEYFARN
ncbi:NAD dependent epimerase/dehydratase [Xylariaceae sp. FL0016]|nr:NAD dependent epimerase/dehydratase [Xylariaceae sp. FL0016]